jgi:4-amino-4-deoxy-L-arabinose transferase-like glycosyltransferase
VESQPLSGSSRRAWDWRDAVAVAILVLACWATRMPTMDRVALNPDESQYEATAAYLLAEKLSAFSIPHTSPGTYSFYKAVAWVFGPYSMFEVRIVVLLMVIGIALLIYRMVREATSPWSGLAAGLVVALWSLYFEGLTANREWFCNALLVGGVFLFLRGLDRRGNRADLAIIASGALCGAALWFKLHAALLVLPPVGLCLWLAWVGDDRAAKFRALALYALGGLLITLVGMVPFVLAGSLESYLRSIGIDLFGYAAVVEPAGAGQWSFGGRFFFGIPGRPLLLAAYGFAGLVVWAVAYRLVRRRETPPPLLYTPLAVLFTFYLGAAVVTITIGDRFFGHYYLFLVPPVAVVFGLATRLFTTSAKGSRLAAAGAGVYLVLLVLDRAISWPDAIGAATAVYVAVLALLLLYGLSRPSARLATAVAGILALEIVFLGVHVTTLMAPASAPYPRHDFRRLSRAIDERSQPTDRIFVWGWAPEVYSLTRLTPASQFVISMYLVNDTRPQPATSAIDPRYETQLMDELRAVEPRFIVDASSRSWTMVASGDPWLYRLDRYPDFALNRYLASHYRSVGRFDGSVLFERQTHTPLR